MKPRHKLETQVSACNDLWQANGNTIVATNTSTRFLGMHSQGCAERQRLRNGKSSADWEANGTSSSSSCSSWHKQSSNSLALQPNNDAAVENTAIMPPQSNNTCPM